MGHRISKFVFGALLCFVATLARGAEIEGTVVIKHTLTKRKVTVAAGQYDRGTAVPLGSTESEDRLAFERSHVVIYLEGARDSPSDTPPASASIEQKERQFVPDMVVIPAGSSISFPNLDPIFHNVFSLSKPRTFDLGNYSKGQTRLVTFPKPGIVFVNCRLHPNMTAAIVVSPNRWNTIADPSGAFALHNVPPGTYTIVAWHKTAGFFREHVDLQKGSAKVEFVIPLAADGTVISRGSSKGSPGTNGSATHDAADHEAISKR